MTARTLPQPYSRFYVVSLAHIRILYRFVHRQGAPFLPRCWVPVLDAAPLLPVLIPSQVPHPGFLTTALIGLAPLFPVRPDTRLAADTVQPRSSSLHNLVATSPYTKNNPKPNPKPNPKGAAAGFFPFHPPTHPRPSLFPDPGDRLETASGAAGGGGGGGRSVPQAPGVSVPAPPHERSCKCL